MKIKKILTASLAAFVLFTATISASAYNVYYAYEGGKNGFSLKTDVYTAGGYLWSTKSQHSQYPEITKTFINSSDRTLKLSKTASNYQTKIVALLNESVTTWSEAITYVNKLTITDIEGTVLHCKLERDPQSGRFGLRSFGSSANAFAGNGFFYCTNQSVTCPDNSFFLINREYTLEGIWTTVSNGSAALYSMDYALGKDIEKYYQRATVKSYKYDSDLEDYVTVYSSVQERFSRRVVYGKQTSNQYCYGNSRLFLKNGSYATPYTTVYSTWDYVMPKFICDLQNRTVIDNATEVREIVNEGKFYGVAVENKALIGSIPRKALTVYIGYGYYYLSTSAANKLKIKATILAHIHGYGLVDKYVPEYNIGCRENHIYVYQKAYMSGSASGGTVWVWR